MSEKAAVNKEKNNVYIFAVLKDATKSQVKEAVEQLFKKKVTDVRLLNVKTKPKRFRNIQGRTKAWKKAYVTLESGQTIEFAGA